MDLHDRSAKKNTSHGNEVLPQDRLLRISYKDHVTNEEVPAKIQQVTGPHVDLLDHRKETQTAVVSSRLPLNRSGDGLARPRLPLIWSGLSMWQGTVKG